MVLQREPQVLTHTPICLHGDKPIFCSMDFPVSGWGSMWSSCWGMYLFASHFASPLFKIVWLYLSHKIQAPWPALEGPLGLALSSCIVRLLSVLTTSSAAFLWSNLSPNAGHSDGHLTLSLQTLANTEGLWAQHSRATITLPKSGITPRTWKVPCLSILRTLRQSDSKLTLILFTYLSFASIQWAVFLCRTPT